MPSFMLLVQEMAGPVSKNFRVPSYLLDMKSPMAERNCLSFEKGTCFGSFDL